MGVSHLPRHDQRFGRFAAAVQPRMAADFDHRLRHQDDLDHHRRPVTPTATCASSACRRLARGYRPVGRHHWTIVTPGPDGAIPIEALREEKALPCYVDAAGDCQDLRTYLIPSTAGCRSATPGPASFRLGRRAGQPLGYGRCDVILGDRWPRGGGVCRCRIVSTWG